MKKIKTKIIHIPSSDIDDGLFDDNVCPICGHNIKNIIPCQREDENFLNKVYYREVILRCPECKTEFSKKVIDKREWLKRRIKFTNIMGGLSLFSFFGILPSFILSIEMDNAIFILADLMNFAIFAIFWTICWYKDL